MKRLFGLLRKEQTAVHAKQRLQIIVKQSGNTQDDSLVQRLQDEILSAVSKHMTVDREQVSVKLNEQRTMLELSVSLNE